MLARKEAAKSVKYRLAQKHPKQSKKQTLPQNKTTQNSEGSKQKCWHEAQIKQRRQQGNVTAESTSEKNSENSKTMLGTKHTENSEDKQIMWTPNKEKGESTSDDMKQADESEKL